MKLDIKNKRTQFLGGLTLTLLAIILVAVLVGNRQGIEYVEGPPTEVSSRGFSFFGVGAESLLTKGVRGSLSDKLGADTVERHGTIDLSLNYKGFIEQHFPDLDALNRQLNDAVGARVEHNTLSITYRYPPKGETPFDYVRLVFSGYTKRPLVIRVTSEQEGSPIIGTLTEQYGQPRVIQWKDGLGESHSWRQGKNVLIASQYANRIGQPELQVRICFVDNIDELLSTERKEALEKEESRSQAARSAF